MRRALGVLWIVTGCYSAAAVDGLPCTDGVEKRCPEGQSCELESLTCFTTPPPQLTLKKVSAGENHTCGIDAAGALWCWGRNQFGQLGLGDADDRAVPTRVGADTDWTEISAGDDGTCGLRGTMLFCWGNGNIVGIQANTPAMVTATDDSPPATITAWKSVSVGGQGYCAVSSDGRTMCRWEADPAFTRVDDAGTLPGPHRAEAVFASNHRQCILNSAHELYCWGANDSGQAGQPSNMSTVTSPTQVAAGPGPWSSVTATGKHTCSIDADAHLWCWGACLHFQVLGVPPPETTPCPPPMQVGTDTYLTVASSENETCAVTQDHRLLCFGANEAGQLGTSTVDPFSVPVPVSGALTQSHSWKSVTVGGEHACGITLAGNAWCWGYNRYGNLGDENLPFAQTPQRVENDTWEQVSAGDTTTCAIRTDGTLWCWGNNGAGQLGDHLGTRHETPSIIDTNKDWFAISTGTNHTCGLRGAGPGMGSLYCWGSNRDGQLGLGSTTDETEPVPRRVGIETDWIEIQAGTMETCGTRTSGGLFCWGDHAQKPAPVAFDNFDAKSITMHAAPERFGQGAGALSAMHHVAIVVRGPKTPTSVTPDNMLPTDSTSTTLGADHSCGLSSGVALCWGGNGDGQLGRSCASPCNASAPVDGTMVWSAIDAGGFATCGITQVASALFCWGRASMIGSPITADSTASPTAVAPGTQWSSVSVGHRHVCGIQQDHSLWCWGDNLQGELGTGSVGTDWPIRVHRGSQ